ncbi:MAG: universal stress protein [Acidimicrobiales bacterium]
MTACPVEVVTVASPGAAMAVAARDGDLSESSHVDQVAAGMSIELGRPVNAEVLHGKNPARTIIDHLASRPFGLVAMATHGATGLARLAAGSVTADIIKKAPVPVLVLRPPHLNS